VIPARFSKPAQEDLEKIQDRIAIDNPEAAKQVRQALLDIADLLGQNIEAGNRVLHGSPRHTDVRWFVVPRFRNYLLFYRPYQDSILVLRILHAKQDWTRFFR
jgi:plasmid stabilization system protein ParE